MNRNRAQNGVAAVLIAALVLAMTALPAFAAGPAKATAEIVSQRALLQGKADTTVTVAVTNASPTTDNAKNVNYVNLFLPVDIVGNIRPVAPQGWDARLLAGGSRVVFFTQAAVFAMAPGQTLNFGATVDIGRTSTDLPRQIGVSTSADGLTSSFASSKDGDAANMTLDFRMIEIRSIGLDAPERSLDYVVTRGQNNVDVVLTLVNHGSAELKGVSADVTDDESGKQATSAAANLVDLPAGGTQPINTTLTMTFHGLGSDAKTVLSGDAVLAGVANAITQSGKETIVLPEFTIQAPVNLTYVAGTLSPKVITPGQTTTFTAQFYNPGPITADDFINQGSALVVNIQNNPTPLRLALTSPDSIGSKQDSVSGNNTPGPITFTFETAAIPGDPTQVLRATTVFEARYRDANGWLTGPNLELNEFLIDPFAPVVQNLLLTPQGTEVELETDAVGNNRWVTYSGTIERAGNACGDCRILSASIVFDNDQAINLPTGGKSQAIRNNGGTIEPYGDGTRKVTIKDENGDDKEIRVFDVSGITAGATSARIVVDVAAPSGLQVDADPAVAGVQLPASPAVPVDIIAARSMSASTGPTANTVTLTFTERVRFPVDPQPSDFTVTNHVVSNVELIDTKGLESKLIANAVRLTLATQLGEDETPSVSYNPPVTRDTGTGQGPTRAIDRVKLPLAANSVIAVDGIIPKLPVLETVGGQAIQFDTKDGAKQAYFTNLDDPSFVVSNVRVGHGIQVYRDVNENNVVDGGDTPLIAQCDVQDDLRRDNGNERQTCFLDTTFNTADDTEARLRFIVRVMDGAGNLSNSIGNTLVLDKIAPKIVSVMQSGATDIVITLNEAVLKGSDSTLNWTPADGTNAYNVGSISKDWDKRILTVDDFRYSSSTKLTKVYYEHWQGARYVDRAGNQLADTTYIVS